MKFKNRILSDAQCCEIKSFGDLNPDKYFLVIQQEGCGRGLFSLLSSVLCYLDFADRFGFIPIVDFENFQNVYNESESISGTNNSFNYYFESVTSYSLDEVYASKHVVFTGSGYPKGYSYSITSVPDLHVLWDKYIKIKPHILAEVNKVQESFSEKTLGIHFRGQEMRTAAGHWFPPSKKQMFYAIDQMNSECGFRNMFVVTEDSSLLKLLIDRYGPSVVYSDHYRTARVNGYLKYPRKHHKYLLGFEVCVDMILLSRCQGLIHCTSNVAEMAKFLNKGKYSCVTKINNGPNSRFWPLARILWYVKDLLPAFAGGFSTDQKYIILQKHV